MDRQTLRDWVHRFNEEGPDGLTNRKGAGRTRYLSDVQMKELGEIVETGPDPAVDGVVRWRRIDLKRVIEARFGVIYSERGISRLLGELGFAHISARPQHPRQDKRIIEAFKPTFPIYHPNSWNSYHFPTAKGTVSPMQPSDGMILVIGPRLEGHSVIFLAIQTHLSCRFLLAVDSLGLRRSGSSSQIVNGGAILGHGSGGIVLSRAA